MALSDRQMLQSLSRMPFVDTMELAGILGEPLARPSTARWPGLLAKGIVGRVSHGTAHLPSSQRYYLTAQRHQRGYPTMLGFDDALGLRAGVPRVQGVVDAADPPNGRGGRRSTVLPPHSPPASTAYGRTWSSTAGAAFDATITLHDGRSIRNGTPEPGSSSAARSTTG